MPIWSGMFFWHHSQTKERLSPADGFVDFKTFGNRTGEGRKAGDKRDECDDEQFSRTSLLQRQGEIEGQGISDYGEIKDDCEDDSRCGLTWFFEWIGLMGLLLVMNWMMIERRRMKRCYTHCRSGIVQFRIDPWYFHMLTATLDSTIPQTCQSMNLQSECSID